MILTNFCIRRRRLDILRTSLGDPDLTLNEKRAVLASWASDACAIEAAPDLRSNARGAPVRLTTSWKRCAHSIGKPTDIVIGACCITAAACSAASPQNRSNGSGALLSRKNRGVHAERRRQTYYCA